MWSETGGPRGRAASAAAFILGAGAVVTFVDLAAGAHVSLASAYVVLVVVAAWEWGLWGALLTSLLSTGAAILSNHLLRLEVLTTDEGCAQSAGSVWWSAAARLFVFALVGLTVSTLREQMRARDSLVLELQQALSEIRTLQGLLPICAWCKRIRDEEQGGKWLSVETYIASKTAAQFTHGICPECRSTIEASKKDC